MKTIVLATDLSPNGNRAASFAAQLARDQKAQLVLLHVYQNWPDDPAQKGDFLLLRETMQESSEKSLQQLADDLRQQLGADVPMQCIAREGHAMDVIRSTTKAEHADLLIMATVGMAPQRSHPRRAQLLGSIATEMVSKREVPLLLVPPGITYGGVKKVVLGIDLAAPPDAISFDTALSFLHSTDSVIHVLCITDKLNDINTQLRAEHIRHLLIQHAYTLTIRAKEGEIYDALLAFAHAVEADLIIMLPHMRNWLKELFFEGETRHMVRLTDIPLLAVV